MSIAVFLKNNLRNIPPNIGRLINGFPYNYRPGIRKVYRQRKREIEAFTNFTSDEKRAFIYYSMKHIVEFAYKNVPAYKSYYSDQEFTPALLKSFDDIKLIPLTNKSILSKYDLEVRSFPKKGRYIVNTGGSSGTPFNFYIQPDSMGHEWAHMHTIWDTLGFNVADFKLVFGGRSNIRDYVDYDVVRNSFAIDLYADYGDVSKKLKLILEKYSIKYLHGYPSSIYDFAVYCKDHDKELQHLLSKQLKGAFMGSEFPHPHYRDAIEEIFDIRTISWYGHTERCVLAGELNEKYVYEPFQTYGYTEFIDNNGAMELVSTSYYNEASPLIRYNTDDEIIDPVVENGILKSF